jgi:hypothetical protein
MVLESELAILIVSLLMLFCYGKFDIINKKVRYTTLTYPTKSGAPPKADLFEIALHPQKAIALPQFMLNLGCRKMF